MILPYPGDYPVEGIMPLMLDPRIWEYKVDQPVWMLYWRDILRKTEVVWQRK